MNSDEKKKIEKIDPKKYQIDIAELQNRTQQIYSASKEKMKKFRI